MLWMVALLLCLSAGWFLARALIAGSFPAPRWASLLLEVSLGVLFGPGLASLLYFGLVSMGRATQWSVLAALATFVGACVAIWWKLAPPSSPAPVLPKRFPWNWALWICVAVGLVVLLLDFQTASNANPAGQWDAMAVWNLRARFLASGDLWRRAVASSAPHPGYPLFLSGFIGLQWTAGGAFDETVPIAAGLLAAMAVWLLLGSSLAARKSVALGLLAWLVLLASEVFASQAAVEYSDLLLGLAFLAVLVLLEAAPQVDKDTRSARLCVAIGLAAGLTCWIKNEGLPFAFGVFVVAAWRFRTRGLPWLVLGAAPGLLATAFLKLFLAQGVDQNLPRTFGQAITNFLGPGRWWQAALGYGKAIFEAGDVWTHPVLLCAVLAFALRFVPAEARRARLWLWVPVTLTVAAEYLQFLTTEVNLDWQISGSANRLLAQLWPSLIFLFFLLLRTPEEWVEVAPAFAPSARPQKVTLRKR